MKQHSLKCLISLTQQQFANDCFFSPFTNKPYFMLFSLCAYGTFSRYGTSMKAVSSYYYTRQSSYKQLSPYQKEKNVLMVLLKGFLSKTRFIISNKSFIIARMYIGLWQDMSTQLRHAPALRRVHSFRFNLVLPQR